MGEVGPVDSSAVAPGALVGALVGAMLAPPPHAASTMAVARVRAPTRNGRSIVTRLFLHVMGVAHLRLWQFLPTLIATGWSPAINRWSVPR